MLSASNTLCPLWWLKVNTVHSGFLGSKISALILVGSYWLHDNEEIESKSNDQPILDVGDEQSGRGCSARFSHLSFPCGCFRLVRPASHSEQLGALSLADSMQHRYLFPGVGCETCTESFWGGIREEYNPEGLAPFPPAQCHSGPTSFHCCISQYTFSQNRWMLALGDSGMSWRLCYGQVYGSLFGSFQHCYCSMYVVLCVRHHLQYLKSLILRNLQTKHLPLKKQTGMKVNLGGMIADHDLEVSQLIPALASLMGSKAASAQRGSSNSLAAKDAASQQLEVLQALLLLLQMPQVSQKSERHSPLCMPSAVGHSFGFHITICIIR